MKLVLVTGKGGAGTSTIAAATAHGLAARGERTLLLATSRTALASSADRTEVAAGLWSARIDPQRRFEAAWQQFADVLTRGGVAAPVADELTVLPGLDDVLTLLAITRATRAEWDTIVLDAGPASDALRLVALPETLGRYLTRVTPLQQRLARAVRPFAGLLGGAGAWASIDATALLTGLADELVAAHELLADPDTARVRLVLTPESVGVTETFSTYAALALFGLGVDLVVANHVVADDGGAWTRARSALHSREVARLRAALPDVPVRTVAVGAEEPLDATALLAIARELYGDDHPIESLAAAALAEPVVDRRVPELRLRVPLARRDEVDVARVGDDLVVTVAGHRRVLALPDALAPHEIVGGGYDGAELRVRFRRARPRPRPTADGDG